MRDKDFISNMDLRANREDYLEAMFTTHVKRQGASDLLETLKGEGFLEAPASTKYHLAEDGGLLHHSINVTLRLLEMQDASAIPFETLVICGMLHDVCKIDCYVKDGNGWKYNEDARPGHGEKSVRFIEKYMRLTEDEAEAIRWHMGAFDAAARFDTRDLNKVWNTNPLALMLHIADMQAAYLDEK